ncbi:hypothetical protein BAE44_0022385 [Dichanthelium oligosanthes]|uniref:Uncharacterized protein n=1 Tax=Dichanthelium oligosanthes TaxID=888268 RepID=A0A1E5UUN7_9POAL|nr:hypothetical protein BAE44_0022385 [Dichanthelium oligosanthes]
MRFSFRRAVPPVSSFLHFDWPDSPPEDDDEEEEEEEDDDEDEEEEDYDYEYMYISVVAAHGDSSSWR